MPDSYRALQFEIIFRTQVSTKSADNVIYQDIQIPAHEYLQSLSVEMLTGGAWSGALTLFDPNTGYLENLILAAGTSRDIIFRWGYTTDEDGNDIPISKLRAFRGHIVKYEPTFAQEGTTLVLQMVHAGFVDAVINNADDKVRSWPGEMSASDIVLDIARRRGWQEFQVDASGSLSISIINRRTVEPTDGPIGEAVTMKKGMDDATFIRQVLIPLARNADNVGGYLFGVAPHHYGEGSVVYFQTPNYLGTSATPAATAAVSKAKLPIQKTYTVARDQMGEVISFAPSDDKFFASVLGSGNVTYVGLDSFKGSQEIITVSEIDGVPGSKRSIHQDAEYTTEIGSEKIRATYLSARTAKELERMAAAKYDRLRDHQYKADLEVLGTHDIRVFGHIEVNYFRFAETLIGTDEVVPVTAFGRPTTTAQRIARTQRPLVKHYLSGVYRVDSVAHEVSTSGWTTRAELFRTGHGDAEGAVEQGADRKIDASAPTGTLPSMEIAEVRNG